MRLVNIYDVNAKTYIFKFARNEEKVFVLIESGLRMHSTEFFRDKNQMPSGFTMKVSNPAVTAPLDKALQAGTRRPKHCLLVSHLRPLPTPLFSPSHPAPSSPHHFPPLLPLPTPRPSSPANPLLVPPHPSFFFPLADSCASTCEHGGWSA